MKLKSGLVLPGDKGFDEKKYKDYFWNVVRGAAKMPVDPKVKIEIHGFFLVDTRRKPHVAIWKNCQFELIENTRPLLTEPPKSFAYLEEAIAFRAAMHLSMDDQARIEICALSPVPGLEGPMPQYITFEKGSEKGR